MSALTTILSLAGKERQITGLTGGTLANLDGIETATRALSPQPHATFVIGGNLYNYFLRAGTDAEAVPGIIRPDDYAGGTNEKVWELIVASGSGDMLSINNLSDVDDAAISRTNLGVEIGADVQAYSVNLTGWAGITTASKQDALGFTPLNAASNLSDLVSASTARTNLGVAIGTNVEAWSANLDAWSALATSAKQNALGFTPLNPANNLSDLANAGTARTNLGLAIGSNVQAWDADLDLWAAIAPSAKQNALGYTPLNPANNLSDVASASNSRTNLGLVIGTDVEAHTANLSAWSAIATSTKLSTASNLSDLANAGTARTNLGLAIGTNVEAWSANLDAWSALATSAKLTTSLNLSDLPSASTARTNLGLAIGTNVQAWASNLDDWALIAESTKSNNADNLQFLANKATSRTNLGVAIGSNVQAWAANLDAWALLATSAKLTTTSNLSDLNNVSTARTNLGLAIGSNVEAWSANLDAWSAIATSTKLTTASNLSDVPSPSTARTNLGLAIGTNVPSQSDMSTAQTDITNLKKVTIPFLIDGGGSAIATGSKGWVAVPIGMTITKWEIFADVSGSIVVNVNRATYANLPTFTAISASAQPTLTAAQKNTDATLTGWTTSLTTGDWLEFNVASASTVTRVMVVLYCTRT